jgi:arylsulfatase A-like enzyme
MSEPRPDAQLERTNAIWIFGDQHRGQMLSCHGDCNLNTPNIDLLAGQGLDFPNAVSGFPLCCPFRGSLLTGRYPHHCVPGHEYPLPKDARTIAQVFNETGYHTGYFGKWHLGGHKERDGRAAFFITDPAQRGGFQQWAGYDNNNSQWDSWVHGGEGGNAFHYRLPGYETDALTDLLLAYLKERAQKPEHPFFAVLSVQPPHDPYLAPPDYMARHNPAALQLRPNVPRFPRIEDRMRKELAGACAQVENLDWNVGRVMALLQQSGLLFNTHVLFFSDHGDQHGSHGQFRKTNPLEESLRIPFMIGGVRPDAYGPWRRGTSPVPVNHVDIAPTTLGLCGLPVPDWMEGTDYSRHRIPARPQVEEPDSAYLQSVIPTGHGDSIDKPWRGLVTRDGWKYVCLPGQSWLLFNLNEDPYERANLAHNSAFKGQRARLLERLRQWIQSTHDEFILPQS